MYKGKKCIKSMKGKEYIKERKRLLRMEIDRNRRLWKHHAGRSDIIFFSSSNNDAANVLASSVLPTPVGPKNKNEPIGLFGFAIPALALNIASLTF